MCKIDQRACTVIFAAIRRGLRKLFATMGVRSSPLPYKHARVNTSVGLIKWAKSAAKLSMNDINAFQLDDKWSRLLRYANLYKL